MKLLVATGLLFVVTFVASGALTEASASVVHRVRISNGCTSDGLGEVINRNSTDGTDVAASTTGSQTFNGCVNSGTAIAGGGFLGIFADSTVTGGADPRTYGSSITVSGDTTYSDIGLTTPANYAGGLVETALSFNISGIASGTTVDGALPSTFESSFTYIISVSNGANNPDIINTTITVEDRGDEECPPGGCSQSAPGTITTSTFLWDPTRTLGVSLGLTGTVRTGALENGSASAEVNLLNTLNFSETSAFILPTGFSVNYADANIVNNGWVDPRAPSTVPLPAGILLLIGALGWLGLFSRPCGRRPELPKVMRRRSVRGVVH